jgi:hypothetical protein
MTKNKDNSETPKVPDTSKESTSEKKPLESEQWIHDVVLNTVTSKDVEKKD